MELEQVTNLDFRLSFCSKNFNLSWGKYGTLQVLVFVQLIFDEHFALGSVFLKFMLISSTNISKRLRTNIFYGNHFIPLATIARGNWDISWDIKSLKAIRKQASCLLKYLFSVTVLKNSLLISYIYISHSSWTKNHIFRLWNFWLSIKLFITKSHDFSFLFLLRY